MNMSEFFGNFIPGARQAAPAPTAPAANAPVTGQIPASAQTAGATVASAATAVNGLVPAAAATPPTVESKLEPLNDIWQNVANQEPGKPLFVTSKDAMLELARKQDFKPQLTQEQIAAIAGGGPEAVSAIVEAMNDMTQRVYAQSTHASTQLIEAAATKMNAAAAESMNKAISHRTIQSTLQTANPLLANPAVSPLVEMATKQLTTKHPTASPQEISSMVSGYISTLAEVFTAPQTAAAQQASTQAATAKEEDWGKFFDLSKF